MNAAGVRQPRLLDQVRTAVRVRGYSLSTERTYAQWVKRFVIWHGNVSASTQNQALAALLFLYRNVLDVELPWLDGLTRAKPSYSARRRPRACCAMSAASRA
jgi:hypothetical protein